MADQHVFNAFVRREKQRAPYFALATAVATHHPDNHERIIRVMRGYSSRQRKIGRTLLLSPYEGIEYVLVSHVLSRRETGPQYDRIWPEVWIHLYSPRKGFIA